MRPLNGKCAMTREERNARRRELDADPFHHALTLKTARKNRAKNRDKLNARNRERYAEHREEINARLRAKRAADPVGTLERERKYWRKWRSKPGVREYLKQKYREYASVPEHIERKKSLRAARKAARTPEQIEAEKKRRRDWYHRTKRDASGIRWTFKQQWRPRWTRLVDEGPEAISRYQKRCTPRTKFFLNAWLQGGDERVYQLTGKGRVK